MSVAAKDPEPLRLPSRAFGVVPLLFVFAALTTYARIDRLSELLWMCNVANVILGVGFLARSPPLVWIGTICVVVGTPLWVWDTLIGGAVHWHSFLTHVASAGLGVWAASRLEPRRWGWLIAVAIGVTIQLVSRFVARPELNVNVSQRPYAGLEGVFESYAFYWVFNLVGLAFALFIAERVLVFAATVRRREA